jgi:hypothetical protein
MSASERTSRALNAPPRERPPDPPDGRSKEKSQAACNDAPAWSMDEMEVEKDMGRTSRAKKERRKARRKHKPSRSIPVRGPAMTVIGMTGSFDEEHGPLDDCPICTAMREIGLVDGEVATPEQFERLQEAFGEARRQGASVWWGPPGEN